MRRVGVVGVGITRFGKLEGRGLKDLGREAVVKALRDAGLSARDIQIAYCGYAMSQLGGQATTPGQLILKEVGVTGIPVTRVENACASGASAFREAWLAIQTGLYDVALAFGVEKMTGAPTPVTLEAMASAADIETEGVLGLTFPGVFAIIARRHMAQYGTTREQMALVAVKNHRHAALNPLAQFPFEVTVEQVIHSPPVAEPLRLYDCCPVSDGAAAAILVSEEYARRQGLRPIWVAASVLASGTYADDLDLTTFGLTQRAAAQAYEMAGLGPDDVNLAEVHDCFTIAEIIHYEDLGFCAKGEGGALVESGATALGGRLPVNVSGGLKAKGHPVGATGVAQIVEVVEQLRGRAGARQVHGARVGLTHTMGGFTRGDGASVAVHILTV